MEVADVVAINKADGETQKAAARAASEYSGCLHLMPHRCVCVDGGGGWVGGYLFGAKGVGVYNDGGSVRRYYWGRC